jgi:transposase-like protein
MLSRRPGWQPPHCPNPNCKYHNGSTDGWRFKRKGYYLRLAKPHRIQRFTCLHCKRTFSTQTFSTTYWQRLPWVGPKIFMMVVGGMANRQIARAIHVAPSTVDRHLSRLGRHCMLFHAYKMQGHSASDTVVVDGFETFELSQYFPFHHNVAVEADTGFFLHHTDSPLRRKGRMTAHQKKRRTELEKRFGRPDPQAVRKGMHELLEVVTRGKQQITIRSDEHRSYRPAMRDLDCRIRHEVTSSRDHRDKRNPLWEVNLLDLLIRHGSAGHKRETIAWPKRRQCSAERLSILLVWRNYVKRRWEKGPAESPAMLKGIVNRLLNVSDVLRERLFRTRVELSETWSRYYRRDVKTPALGVNRAHELRLAF